MSQWGFLALRGWPKLQGAGVVALLAGMALPVEARADAVIHITFVETHDRKPPDERIGITQSHSVEATLGANGRISENFEVTMADRRGRGRFAGSGSHETKLGDTDGNVTWRVKGPHRLLRVAQGPSLFVYTNIDVQNDNTCSATVDYRLKPGHTDMYGPRRDTGEMAHFTLPTVLSVECSIR